MFEFSLNPKDQSFTYWASMIIKMEEDDWNDKGLRAIGLIEGK